MDNQVIASLFVGLCILLAAFMLHQPAAVLLIALSGALAWVSHEPGFPVSSRIIAHWVGIGFAGLAVIYLISKL